MIATCVFNAGRANPCITHPLSERLAAYDGWSHVALEASFAKEGHVVFEQDGKVMTST